MFLDLLIFVSYIFPVENPLLGESAGNVFHFWWFSKQTQVFWPSQDTKDIIIQSSHGWLSATTLFLRVFFSCAGECESLLPILGGRYQEDGLGKGPRWLSWWSLDDLQPPWWISEKGGHFFRGQKREFTSSTYSHNLGLAKCCHLHRYMDECWSVMPSNMLNLIISIF